MKESFYESQLLEEKQKEYQESVELIDRGQRKKAAKKLDNLLAENPDFLPALNKKAVIFIYWKEFKEAKSLLNQILNQDPDYAPALTNLGSIAREMGDLNRAKELYQKAIKVDEDYGPAYNNLAVVYREEGNYSKSVRYLKKARKKGSINYQLNADKPFYKDPGCLFIIFLAVEILFVLFFILT